MHLRNLPRFFGRSLDPEDFIARVEREADRIVRKQKPVPKDNNRRHESSMVFPEPRRIIGLESRSPESRYRPVIAFGRLVFQMFVSVGMVAVVHAKTPSNPPPRVLPELVISWSVGLGDTVLRQQVITLSQASHPAPFIPDTA